jgi:hypothetical protein
VQASFYSPVYHLYPALTSISYHKKKILPRKQQGPYKLK